MNRHEVIRKAIKELAKGDSFQVFPAQVLSVNENNGTCAVKMIANDLDLFEVRLRATIDGEAKGILIVPQVGSKILVGLINDDLKSLFVVSVSAVDKVQYDDGSYGGFVRADILKTELDKTNQVVEAIVNSLSNWSIAPGDGGAALKSHFISQLSGKEVGNYNGIENGKLTHGQ